MTDVRNINPVPAMFADKKFDMSQREVEGICGVTGEGKEPIGVVGGDNKLEFQNQLNQRITLA